MKAIERIDYGNEIAVPAQMEITETKLSEVCSRIRNRIQNGIVQMIVCFGLEKFPRTTRTRQTK